MRITKPIGYDSWPKSEQYKWFKINVLDVQKRFENEIKRIAKSRPKLVFRKPPKAEKKIFNTEQELMSVKAIFKNL